MKKINFNKIMWGMVLCLFANLCNPSFTWGAAADHLFSSDDESIMENRLADIRYHIRNTDEWPNCLFGKVEIDIGKGLRRVGSGTLIGPDIVLTAAHMIYKKSTKEKAFKESIHFYPARGGKLKRYEITVENYYYPKAFESCKGKSKHDWALLKLTEPVGYKIGKEEGKGKQGWFDLKVFSNKELEERIIHIWGYPGEKSSNLFGVTGQIRNVRDGIITYELDTTKGQSGGGVWTELNGTKYIIGCHQAGHKGEFNSATHWTEEHNQEYLDAIRAWSPKIPAIAVKHEDIYLRFLKGLLIYRPNIHNDEGMIILPIAALPNPLESSFDLSNCRNIGQYVSISTGYKKDKKVENKDKVEIWITPKFVIEQELEMSAKYLKPVMKDFTQPVGLFWTWGDFENKKWQQYSTTRKMDEMGLENLYQKWTESSKLGDLDRIHVKQRGSDVEVSEDIFIVDTMMGSESELHKIHLIFPDNDSSSDKKSISHPKGKKHNTRKKADSSSSDDDSSSDKKSVSHPKGKKHNTRKKADSSSSSDDDSSSDSSSSSD